ncbi:hypothetical protein ABVB34_18400 [Vibrio cholerae]
MVGLRINKYADKGKDTRDYLSGSFV